VIDAFFQQEVEVSVMKAEEDEVVMKVKEVEEE
jgi:hypothetical protein